MTDKQKTQALIDECLILSKNLSGIPCSDRMDYATGFFTRQVFTAHTIWRITNPVPTNDFAALGTKTFQDFPSCFVLLRTMYETCVQARYMLLDPKFEKVSNVIFHVTALHSLRERHKLGTSLASKASIFQEIAQELERRKTQIVEHNEYSKLPESIHNWVNTSHEVSRDWDKVEPEKKAKSAGFHGTWHYQYNKYFSNYVHCDALSIEQVNAVRESNDAKKMTDNVFQQLQNFICHALNTHSQVCKSEGVEVILSELARDTITIWEYVNKADISQETLE